MPDYLVGAWRQRFEGKTQSRVVALIELRLADLDGSALFIMQLNRGKSRLQSLSEPQYHLFWRWTDRTVARWRRTGEMSVGARRNGGEEKKG